MGDDYPFGLRQPRSGIAGTSSLMGPIGQNLLARNRQRLEAIQQQTPPISPEMQELFGQIRQVREEYYSNPESLLAPGMKGLFDEIRQQRAQMTPEEIDQIRQQRMSTTPAQPASMPTTAQPASMPTTPQAPSTAAASQAISGAPREPIALRAMEVPTSLGPELPQPTSVAGDVGKFFKSKQGGALLAAGGVLLASGVLGGKPDESPITDRIKELEGTEQYGRFLDIASRTAPSRADYLGVMAARGGSAVQAEEAAQAAQSRAAREAVSEYNRYRVAADAQAAELRLALQQQREQRRLARIQGFGAALGTAAGFLLAGPAGAQIGGALGSGAGSVLGDTKN